MPSCRSRCLAPVSYRARQLIDRARASDCRVVGISAPAGYGKTTLLAEWAAAGGSAVGWVSLDRFDDDPDVLLTVLASAYSRVSPGHADLVADMGGLGCLGVGSRRATPRDRVADQPESVRADARRSSRAALPGLSRRARAW